MPHRPGRTNPLHPRRGVPVGDARRLQLARVLTGPVTQVIWLPVAVFEVVVSFWLMLKGAAAPAAR